MKILIVDDMENRRNEIVKCLSNRGIEHEFLWKVGPAYVADGALSWADAVFLDHDMCQAGYGEAGVWDGTSPYKCPSQVVKGVSGSNMLDPMCGCPTGMDLVKRMIELPYRPKALVHTANSVEGPRMVERLSEAGFPVQYIPALTWRSLNWGRVEKWLISTNGTPDSV